MTHSDARFLDLRAGSRRASMSVISLRRAIRDGRLRAYRPLRRVLIDVDELDAFVRAASTLPVSGEQQHG